MAIEIYRNGRVVSRSQNQARAQLASEHARMVRELTTLPKEL